MINSYIVNKNNTPVKAAFPVIDAHNHLWGNWDLHKVVQVMDKMGVVGYCDLTSNVRIKFEGGGYVIDQGDINGFFKDCVNKHPRRFYGFTMSNFASPTDSPLFSDSDEFVASCLHTLRDHVKKGAKGLKVLKELGLRYRDDKGKLIDLNDKRLSPIWEEAGRLNIPVLIHQADPSGFFEPVEPNNEHYDSLMKYPDWSFTDQKFPKKEDLIARRDEMIGQHPRTTFILPHFANYAENVGYVANLLDQFPNVIIDFSARIDELGRQPYSAREFFLKYQDRIIFGTDMPANLDSSEDMYRSYFRFLETFDEGFYPPDYDGTFDRARWTICGIGLPPEVLRKIYHENILKIIPSLKDEIDFSRY